jgi:hypothetical protein
MSFEKESAPRVHPLGSPSNYGNNNYRARAMFAQPLTQKAIIMGLDNTVLYIV